jgi:biotin carboxyl carrier protein
VHFDGEAYQLRYEHPLKRLAEAGQGSAEDKVLAPMPGSIVSVQVKAGDAVAKGQTLLVMESMKMETTIAAPRDGVIAAVAYDKGQTFDRDALLLSLEPKP